MKRIKKQEMNSQSQRSNANFGFPSFKKILPISVSKLLIINEKTYLLWSYFFDMYILICV